ncbi:hypothetical protein BOTBODRAFT_488112 [Botryobasidium botryosum FD-172 SS1]|uniref:T6SS Phospholipase effector Tle1-like catalytic domain-containing protein n=1 Tax=Botryobasidium botryosum (strain FD-172 SS1) TaxID=930990 RepID=A0A067MGI9_BOTB1|nr:hypothetical protein BOTBODRAFT_488112 [Botryobasidium botryosum FD-172 SS1]
MAASKMLLVFCDGTGVDGLITDDDDATCNTQYPTNVVRLSRAIKPFQVLPNGQHMAQICYYQSGVGSESDINGESVNGNTAAQAFGIALASKIRDAYAFIAHNYLEGDQICLFGFSRGAYTARKVAGLIDRVGLLKREELGNFFKIWNSLVTNVNPPPRPANVPPIKCVGVWDTVGSIQDGVKPVTDMLNINDSSLPATIENAFHALSLQENRGRFLPTLWTVGPQSLQPGQVMKQVWFGGAHSDVGGGYDRHELSDLSLFWMVGEIQSFVAVDLDYILRTKQQDPSKSWGQMQPHNALDEEPNLVVRAVFGWKTRLGSGQITADAVFHESFRAAPTALTCKAPDHMITLNDIKAKFGKNWTPTFAPLNEFEKKCQEQWGKSAPSKTDAVNGNFSKLETPQGFFSTLVKPFKLLGKL